MTWDSNQVRLERSAHRRKDSPSFRERSEDREAAGASALPGALKCETRRLDRVDGQRCGTLSGFDAGGSTRPPLGTTALVVLDVFQTYRYGMTYIRWDGMTRETYWSVVGSPHIPDEELDLIMEDVALQHSRCPVRNR